MAASKDDTDTQAPAVVLFRHDLRVSDNRALHAAANSGKPVIAVFVFDEESPGVRPVGGARRWWLHHSLSALSDALGKLGVKLLLRRGKMMEVVQDIVSAAGADTVLWNRRYDPPGIEADKAMKTALKGVDIACESFDGHLLHQPWEIRTKTGGPYKVYTPFWHALVDHGDPRAPVEAPKSLKPCAKSVTSDNLEDWDLLPGAPDWAGGLRGEWTPGEAGAWDRLDAFLDGPSNEYHDAREKPGIEGTSRLSPHLAHGEITPFQIWHEVGKGHRGRLGKGLETFRKEIAWREFCWHLLFHNPDLATRNFDRSFDAFAWRTDAKGLKAWQTGETGFPIVDAGMRQLWQTGWMHNRVRMIVASFLVKDLMVDWRKGEAWFWDTLVDADPASNTANWQWVAGSGADASRFFRIFNPVLQGTKFDPEGAYVRDYVPELGDLPDKAIHKPGAAGKPALDDAGVKLAATYPVAIVDHGEARERALAEYKKTKGKS